MKTYLNVQFQDMQRNGVYFDFNESAAWKKNRRVDFIGK